MIPVVKRLVVDEHAPGTRHHLRLETVADGLGWDIYLPVILARGAHPGPTLGLTAAMHGNELNGLPAIHRVLAGLDLNRLHGAIAAVPVINVPGYHRNERRFVDGTDLNRIFPGNESGTNAEVFVARFVDRALSAFDVLVDLHTASFGRVNSLYVRADLTHPTARLMAETMVPQVLLHNRGAEGTLRDAAMDRGIPSITVEIGNPQRIQDELVEWTADGLRRVLGVLDMLDPHLAETPRPRWTPIRCGRSYWVHTDRGGVLEVFPELVQRVRAGERIADVTDVYGQPVREYLAPEDGVIIGKSTNPVNQTGSRIVHLGVEGEPQQAPTAPDA